MTKHSHIFVTSKAVNRCLNLIAFVRDPMPHGALWALCAHAFSEENTKVRVTIAGAYGVARITSNIAFEFGSYTKIFYG